MPKETRRPRPTVYDQEKPGLYVPPPELEGHVPTEASDPYERVGVLAGRAEIGKVPLAMLIGLIALVTADVYKGQPLSRKIVRMLNHPVEVQRPYNVELDNQVVRWGTATDRWGDKNSTNSQK